MRSVSILLLFSYIMVLTHSRPSQSDENNESDLEETDYGGDDKTADESLDEDSGLNNDAPVRDIVDRNGLMDEKKDAYSLEPRNNAENRADRSSSDISDYKMYGSRGVQNDKSEETKNYDDTQNYPKERQSKYIDNKEAADQQEAGQHSSNRNVNYYKNNKIHNNLLLEDPLSKREADVKVVPNQQDELLFQTRDQADKIDLNNEAFELNKRYSKYYAQMHPENKDLIQCKNREGDPSNLYYNRDRRETQDLKEDTSKIEAEKELDKNQNEDEEMAIRRHIKKLSSGELEELLSSLSDEKRQLLKTIIDDTDPSVKINDMVNKREITKKAGAVEENSCIESGQADSNIHGDSSAIDISTAEAAQSSGTTEGSKQTTTQSENQDLPDSKSTEISTANKVGLLNEKEDAVQEKHEAEEASAVGAEKTPAEVVPSDQVTTKNENKRETKLDDLADVISFEDPKMIDNDWLTEDSKDQQECFASQEEDLSQFLDEEQAFANDDSKIYKRDIEKQADYDAKIKSLEESFPKSTNYDESAGPLIRVKRKNEQGLKKRSAAVLPDAKVAFFPYRAENADEDNDEGNEFDDDGFYDRTPNFSNNDKQNIKDFSSCKVSAEDNRPSSNDISKATMSLGTDTDSVLSGVEGVDENLMFSSGYRSRRTTEDNSDVLDETNSIHNSKSLSDESKAVSDINALTFQESDSFGPLPRNEGESGRYKRIRRVKQSHPEGSDS